jgi:hypothetical protein
MSTVWLLARTAEIDARLGDDAFSVRVELFAARGETGRFRARLTRSDVFHLQPTYPLDVWSAPSAPPDAEGLRVAWPAAETPPWQVAAADADAALDEVLDRLRLELGRRGRAS